MLTDNQQKIIDSIVTEFERINKTNSTQVSGLVKRIKDEIADHELKKNEFIAQTKSYELVNQSTFDDFCSQMESLCQELGLRFKYEAGDKSKLFIHVRQISVEFPNLGNIKKSWYVTAPTKTCYGIKGLARPSLYIQEFDKTAHFFSENELPNGIEVIVEEIINVHKRLSK